VAVSLVDIVDGTDIGVIQRRGCTRFAAETLEHLRIVGHVVGEKLQRNEAAESSVLGSVHNPHTAFAQLFDNAVMGNDPANRERGFWHYCVEPLTGFSFIQTLERLRALIHGVKRYFIGVWLPLGKADHAVFGCEVSF
jgi:hypothetical protein